MASLAEVVAQGTAQSETQDGTVKTFEEMTDLGNEEEDRASAAAIFRAHQYRTSQRHGRIVKDAVAAHWPKGFWRVVAPGFEQFVTVPK